MSPIFCHPKQFFVPPPPSLSFGTPPALLNQWWMRLKGDVPIFFPAPFIYIIQYARYFTYFSSHWYLFLYGTVILDNSFLGVPMVTEWTFYRIFGRKYQPFQCYYFIFFLFAFTPFFFFRSFPCRTFPLTLWCPGVQFMWSR